MEHISAFSTEKMVLELFFFKRSKSWGAPQQGITGSGDIFTMLVFTLVDGLLYAR
jgi:hypothetical protein